jgi:hypothetical protein
MARVIIVLVSALVFGLFGLLIGYLTVQAKLQTTQVSGYPGMSGQLLVSYLLAPAFGAAVGFVLSVVTMKLFGPPKS